MSLEDSTSAELRNYCDQHRVNTYMQEIHTFHQLKRMSFCLGFEHMLHKHIWGVSVKVLIPLPPPTRPCGEFSSFVSLGLEAVYAVLSEEPCNVVGRRPNFEYGSSLQEVLDKVLRRKYCVTFPSRPHIRCYFVKNLLSCPAD